MGQADDNSMKTKADPPFLIALNLTQRCNLACDHCYLDAKILKEGSTDELDTGEIKSVLSDIAALSPECMVVLTGGEPLLRRDIEELAAHASARGLMVVIGSNGLMLTPKRVESLKRACVAGIGISLDSLVPEKHDVFRGRKGAWEKTMAAIDACVAGGLAFQLHFSVTDDTADEIDDMVAFARDAGAMVLNVFFLVCTGRGEKYTDISPEKYEQVLRRVAHAAREEKRLMVRAKCAPHFKSPWRSTRAGRSPRPMVMTRAGALRPPDTPGSRPRATSPPAPIWRPRSARSATRPLPRSGRMRRCCGPCARQSWKGAAASASSRSCAAAAAPARWPATAT
jgi:MoaA/NifB/PqqE/SkfB family radical SAM enzyme